MIWKKTSISCLCIYFSLWCLLVGVWWDAPHGCRSRDLQPMKSPLQTTSYITLHLNKSYKHKRGYPPISLAVFTSSIYITHTNAMYLASFTSKAVNTIFYHTSFEYCHTIFFSLTFRWSISQLWSYGYVTVTFKEVCIKLKEHNCVAPFMVILRGSQEDHLHISC
jgi:hypothetical protein